MTELLPGAKIPSVLLTGAEELGYVKRLATLLQRARLNSHYPNSRDLIPHIQALDPRLHQGLYPGCEMDARSGLPTYREWTRVQTDVLLASDQLRQLGDREELARKARRDPQGIFGKQLKKFEYYSALEGRPLATLGDMSVALRRIDPKRNQAWFHVLLDKLDATGLFVRYTIELSQRSSAWSNPLVTLDKETAAHTEAFQSLIYKFTSLDAEFTYAKLATLDGLQIERVIKGTIGPFCFSRQMAPEALKPLFERPDDHLGMFSLDMVAHDIPEDRHNDPLEEVFSDKLSQEGRRGYEAARARFGYVCFKDRKFVAARAMVAGLQQLCLERGTRNIIYPA